MAESWEELSSVSASPTLLKKGVEGVKHVAKAARQQKGMCCIPSETHRNITDPLRCVY